MCHVFVLCFILDPPATPPPQLSAAAIAIAGAISGTIFVLAVLFVLITCVSVNKSTNVIGHVNEYPSIHYFGNPRHPQSMVAYMV